MSKSEQPPFIAAFMMGGGTVRYYEPGASLARPKESETLKTQSIRIVCVTISVAALLTLGLAEGTAAAPVAAAALYKTKCAACHGADGKGATTIGKADSIRDLSAADVQGQTDSQLNAIITNGKGKMPAYGKSLKPEQVTSLVAYIRSIASK